MSIAAETIPNRAAVTVGAVPGAPPPLTSITDLIERERGSRNWVVARRTKNILARYGEGAVTLSQQEYRRLEKQFEYETAGQHPAYPLLAQLLGDPDAALSVIRTLRSEGFKIEPVYSERGVS